MNSKYTNVSFPQDMVNEVDKIINASPLYQSRADFCKEAVREHIKKNKLLE